MRPHEDGNYSLDEQHPPLPADVIELVIAARIVAFEDQSAEAIKRLDTASEAFADRVKWDDEDRRARSALAGDGEVTAPRAELIKALKSYQQADQDGVMVLVSRQACDEAAGLLQDIADHLLFNTSIPVGMVRSLAGDGEMVREDRADALSEAIDAVRRLPPAKHLGYETIDRVAAENAIRSLSALPSPEAPHD